MPVCRYVLRCCVDYYPFSSSFLFSLCFCYYRVFTYNQRTCDLGLNYQVLIQRGDEEMQSLRYGQTMDKQALTWLHAERDKWTALNQGLTARVGELEADKVSQQEAVQACHTRLTHLETLTTRQQADWQQSVRERDEALAVAQGLRHQLAEALKEGQESVRQWQQLQQHVASLKVDEVIAAKNAAEVKALEMDMKVSNSYYHCYHNYLLLILHYCHPTHHPLFSHPSSFSSSFIFSDHPL